MAARAEISQETTHLAVTRMEIIQVHRAGMHQAGLRQGVHQAGMLQAGLCRVGIHLAVLRAIYLEILDSLRFSKMTR